MERANVTSRYDVQSMDRCAAAVDGAEERAWRTRAASAMNPLTPYAAIVAGFRRTESLGDRPILSTRWPSMGITERTGDELENRLGLGISFSCSEDIQGRRAQASSAMCMRRSAQLRTRADRVKASRIGA